MYQIRKFTLECKKEAVALVTEQDDKDPVCRQQTGRRESLNEYGITFRPNKPASPHCRGNVERSQKTDNAEFQATVALSTDDLKELLSLMVRK